MLDAVGRFLHFLLHPSDYVGLWTLDATIAGVLLTAATLFIVWRQVGMMKDQGTLMERQTGIMTKQDELNRALLARRVKVQVYAVEIAGETNLYCVNEGGRTTQFFYCHLYIPEEMMKYGAVYYGAGGAKVQVTDTTEIEGVSCGHYVIQIDQALFPTREVRMARFAKNTRSLPIWSKTISEDGVEPPAGLQRVELRPSATSGAIDAQT